MVDSSAIDRIDFGLVGTAEFAQRIGRSLSTTGFFVLENAGIDGELLDWAYAVTADFFELSESVKQGYCLPELHGQRAFTPFGQEHAKDSPHPDLKEFWHVGNPDVQPNLIPVEVPEFSQALSVLYSQLDRCAQYLLAAIADFLGEPLEAIYQPGGDTILRVIHYPPLEKTTPLGSLRSAPHEDINLITLLPTATASGLELLRDGVWEPIDASPGSVIVDSGDMLQWRTNGRLKSTTHRVVNPDNRGDRRFSMPFFVHPHPTTDLTPLASCVINGDVKFPPITAGRYLQQRLAEIGLA